MRDINVKSENEFEIVGILNELRVHNGTTKDNQDYIRLEADVRVDQEINGKVEENIIPVALYANRYKKGTKEINQNYERFKGYADNLTSLNAVEKGEEYKASRIALNAEISENIYAGRDGKVRYGWNLRTNFLNSPRDDEDKAEFTVSGVVVKKIFETDREGNETGRLIVKLCVVGFGGKANVIDFVAEGSAAEYIESHWEQGDTVRAGGVIAMTVKVETIEENFGFGESKVRHNTIPRRELIITRGSDGSLAENECYDADDIKVALDNRKSQISLLESGGKPFEKVKRNNVDLGF